MTLAVIIFALVWLGPAFVAAHLAERAGRSYGMWLFLGLMFGLLALLITACFRPSDAATAPMSPRARAPEPPPFPPCRDHGLSTGAVVTGAFLILLVVLGVGSVVADRFPLEPGVAMARRHDELQAEADAAADAERVCFHKFYALPHACDPEDAAEQAAQARLFDFEHRQ